VVTDHHGGAIVGVLNLQGDVREHVAALEDVGCTRVRLIKRPPDLSGLAGLVLPGGESTTLSKLLESTGLFDVIADAIAGGLPVLGTCAGLVLLATEVLDGRPDQRSFGALNVVVRRNGYRRQLQSFEGEVSWEAGEGPPLPAVFIRAPVIVSTAGDVDVLARTADGTPVLVRQGQLVACSFHPELTPDRRVHHLFTDLCFAGVAR